MNQPRFDFTPHRTHAGDPASSHLAEARLRKSGALNRQQRVVLERVATFPGLTASQISARVAACPGAALFDTRTHQRLCQVRKRLSDLVAKNHAERRHTAGDRESRWFLKGV